MAAAVISEALAAGAGACRPSMVDDVILGCAMPEAEQGMNVARIASLRAGVPVTASAVTVNRFCSSGLQAIAIAAERVRAGGIEVAVAGGTESMSLVPMGGHKVAPNPVAAGTLSRRLPRHGPHGGERWRRSTASTARGQDAFALRSPTRARCAPSTAAASRTRSCPWTIEVGRERVAQDGRVRHRRRAARATRTPTRWPSCARLRAQGGTVTAGNSSQMTRRRGGGRGDVAERARALGLDAAGALRQLRGGRRAPRDHGHRSGAGDPARR